MDGRCGRRRSEGGLDYCPVGCLHRSYIHTLAMYKLGTPLELLLVGVEDVCIFHSYIIHNRLYEREQYNFYVRKYNECHTRHKVPVQ